MECPICYEISAVDNCRQLQCPHSICKLCLGKLQRHICPLCRAPFNFSHEYSTHDNDNELTVNSSDIEWEHISNYDFDFSVEVSTRNRRRRNNRILEVNNGVSHTPLVISEVHITEILYDTHTIEDELVPLISESDKIKQKHRNARNRWKEQYKDNTATSSGR
jgi:hypothetical protein